MLRLTMLSGARAGARVEVAKPIVRLGRSPDCDVAFDPNADLDASAYHAEIRSDGAQYVLVDLASRNGVYLPAQGMRRVQQHVLSHGDQLQFGMNGPCVQVELLGPPPPAAAFHPPPPQMSAPPPPNPAAYPQAQTPGVAPTGYDPNFAAQAYGQGRPPPPPPPMLQPFAQQPFQPGQMQPPPQGQPPAWGGAPPAQAPVDPPKKMGQQTLLAHVGAMLNQKKGKSTREIQALVDTNVKKATGRMRTIVLVLGAFVALAGIAIIVLAIRAPADPAALRKKLAALSMTDPKRKELEKQLALLTGNNENAGRSIYEANKGALYMLVAHRGKAFEKGGFCSAFAIKPRILASNAHCVRAAENFEDKGAKIYVHLNESNSGSKPKMLKVASFKGHPKYRHEGTAITPDVGLFELEDDDVPLTVTLANETDLKKLGTGDSLFVIGFPGRVMDEESPVATFMSSHVGRVTDANGQRAETFDDGWLIQHEGQTTPGTSGSPIFNSDGKVVAINAGGLLEANKQAVYKYAMRIDLIDSIKLKAKKQKSDDDDE